VKASYGTTKYCTFYLKDQTCPNTDCLYLHHQAKDSDCFIKDDVTSNKNLFLDQQKLAFEFIKKHLEEVQKRIAAAAARKEKSSLPPLTSIQ